MDCDHTDVRLTSEPVPVDHCVSVVHWFTCEVCGVRAAFVERTEAVRPG